MAAFDAACDQKPHTESRKVGQLAICKAKLQSVPWLRSDQKEAFSNYKWTFFFFFLSPHNKQLFWSSRDDCSKGFFCIRSPGMEGESLGTPAKSVWCWLKRVFLICTGVFKMRGKTVWSITMIMTWEWNYERNYNYHFYAQLINHKILHYRFFFFLFNEIHYRGSRSPKFNVKQIKPVSGVRAISTNVALNW